MVEISVDVEHHGGCIEDAHASERRDTRLGLLRGPVTVVSRVGAGGCLGIGNAYEPDQGCHPPPGAPPRMIYGVGSVRSKDWYQTSAFNPQRLRGELVRGALFVEADTLQG